MTDCSVINKEMLENPIKIKIKDDSLDFLSARQLAQQAAKEVAAEPMLLAWYDSMSGRFSPNVTCCSDKKPGWLVYAETRGGNVTIDINEEQYIFVFTDMS
jgi:hypothetical protein